MKYLSVLFLLITALLITTGYYTPKIAEDLYDIKWGDSQQKIRRLAGGTKIMDLPDILIYQGSLYGETIYNVDYHFRHNMLVSIICTGTPFDDDEYEMAYKALMENILSGYGAYKDSTDGKMIWTTKQDSLIILYDEPTLLLKIISMPRVHGSDKLY